VGAITGRVYTDNLGNCVVDTTTAGMPGIYVEATSQATGNTCYAVTDTGGYYSITAPDTGTYYLSVIGNGAFFCNAGSCVESAVATIPVTGVSANYVNLAMNPATNGFDLAIFPTWTSGDPGFTKKYNIFYENFSVTPYNGQASVIFVYDPGLVYQYSYGQPYAYLGAQWCSAKWQSAVNSLLPGARYYEHRLRAAWQLQHYPI
jgi:hypothetical protein